MAPTTNDFQAASWWPEFLKIKDTNTWVELARRFNVNVSTLRRAAEDAGLTKVALPRGRKPRSAASVAVHEEPVGKRLAPALAPSETTAVRGPDEILRRLAGKRPDVDVAEAAGVPVAKVKAFRRENSIGPYLRPPPGMTEPPPVGTVVEPSVAPSPTALSPLESIRSRLGTVADQVLAEQIGVTRQVVRTYRLKLGIAAYQGFRFTAGHDARWAGRKPSEPAPYTSQQEVIPFVEVKPTEAPVLKPVAPVAVATLTTATPIHRGRPSKIDAFAHLFGTMSDASIARKAGVTRDAVTKARKRRGIPVWKGEKRWDDEEEKVTLAVDADAASPKREGHETVVPSAKGGEGQEPRSPVDVAMTPAVQAEPSKTDSVVPSAISTRTFRPSKIDAFSSMLGTVLDSVVAKKARVTPEAVRQYRLRHGIPSWSEREKNREAVRTSTVVPPTVPPEPIVASRDDMKGVQAASEALVIPIVEAPLVAEKVAATPKVEPTEAGLADETEPAPKVKKFRWSRIDRYADLVARLPAAKVAKMAGVTVMSIYNYRRTRGIVMVSEPASVAEPVSVVSADRVVTPALPEKPTAPIPDTVEESAAEDLLLAQVEIPVVTTGTKVVEEALPVVEAFPEPAAPGPLEAPLPSSPVSAARIEEIRSAGPAPALLSEGPGVERDVKETAARTGFAVVAKRGEQQRRFAIVAADIADAAVRAMEMLASRTDGSWRVAAIGEIAEILE
jgi:hypothetical protein